MTKVKEKKVKRKLIRWTDERIKEEVLKYKTVKEFRGNSKSCYNAARNKGILKEVCKDLQRQFKPSGYWNLDNCKIEAKKYTTRTQFKKMNPTAYQRCITNGWLDIVCSGMVKVYNSWTNETIHEEALKYNTRVGFKNGNIKAYAVALQRKLLPYVCDHMEYVLGDKYNRYVYMCADKETKDIYIGLTCNLERREYNHINTGYREDVTTLVRENGLVNLTPIPFKAEEAARYEMQLIEHYNNSSEWNCLNRTKGGEL